MKTTSKKKLNTSTAIPGSVPPRGSALIPVAANLPSVDLVEGLSKYAKSGAPNWFGDLLKYSGKTGIYSAGSQGMEIKPGRLLVAVVPEALAGHMLWVDGELADQAWLPAFQFEPRKHRASIGDLDQSVWPKDENGNPQDPWKEAVMIPMIDPTTRAEFTFSTSSYGGVRACKALIGNYTKQLAAAPETTKGCLPLVALQTGSYKHPDKKRGIIHNPVFEGMDWVRASDLLLPRDPGEGESPPPDTL